MDVIGKYSRLSNDFRVENFNGSYDNNAFSLSAEAGWRIALSQQGFVEPQVQLTYGKILGDDFTASNGVRVEQDDFDSLIGRAGVRAGFLFAEQKGSIYGKFSVAHDFKGDAEFTAGNDKKTDTQKDELGGTWYEYGVGANFRWTDKTYTYVDIERTASGVVNENWRWNVSLRHVW